MDELLNRISSQFGDLFKSMSAGKKMALLVAFLVLGGGGAGLFFWAGKTNYVPLMTGLGAEDSTNIIRILRDKHIPFKVDPTGKIVSIPPESLYEFRLELATMGLPQSGVVGYEIFDKQSLGTTTFVQRMNQKRAQEGELVRTIDTIRGVKRTRVHLAMPQKSTFVEDQKKSTASVVVDLEPGVTLSEKQVFGIGNLVARAVEGLEISDVVIMDSSGKVLSKNQSDPLAAASATQLEFQARVQSDYEKRIEEMLARIVGEGHVVAKVTADLDFAQVNETQTLYDGDGSAVRTVQKHNDSMNGSRPAAAGVTGNAANTPGQAPTANGEVKSETTKNNETINYEIPQTIRKTVRSMGGVKRMSVAVVVDGKTVKSTDKDGKVVTKTENWTPEKIKEFEQIAASAVGLDRKRGDTLEVKSIEFNRADFDEAQQLMADKDKKGLYENLATYGGIGLVLLLFLFFVARPFVKFITEGTSDSVDTLLPQTIEELERFQKSSILPNLETLEEAVPVIPENIDPDKVKSEMIKEKIISLVDANPHKAALILKDWLHNEAKKRAAAEAAKNNPDKAASA